MSFVFVALYLLLLSAIIYLYLIGLKALWKIFTFIRKKLQNKNRKKNGLLAVVVDRSEHFRDGWLFLSDKRKNLAVVLLIIGLNIVLFTQNFLHNTTEENKHHDAKVYFALGETANSYKLLALTLLHPDNPLIKPIEWFQRIVYLHGSSVLPENDDEKYLWKQLWFYNPYTVMLTPPRGMRAKPDTPLYNNKHFSEIYNGYMNTLAKVMDGNITDRKLFNAVVPRDIFSNLEFAVIFQMYEDGLRYTGEAGVRIAKETKYQKQTDNLYRYSGLAEEWWKNGTIPENIRSIPQQYLTFLEARMAIAENVMFRKLLLEPTRCDDPFIKGYFTQRQRLLNETPVEYFDRFSMTLNNDQSRFYDYLFPKYCGYEQPVKAQKVNGPQFSRFPYKDVQERNLREGSGYDLQNHESNETLRPLFMAIDEKNTEEVLHILANRNLSPNVRFYGNKTPLHYAAHNNDIATMKVLLKNGANINAEDQAGKIPFQYAIENYNYEASKFLLEHNSSHKWVPEMFDSTDMRNSIDIPLTTSWEYVMSFGALKIQRHRTNMERKTIVKLVKLLIEYRVNFNQIAHYCRETWLHTAVRGVGLQNSPDVADKEAVVKMLLEAGADFRVKNCNGMNAYEEAVNNHSRIDGVFYPYMTKEEKVYYKIR